MIVIDTEATGKRIRQLRREVLRINQTTLADKLKVTNVAVSKWERGVSLPSMDTMMNLSDMLGVTVNQIVVIKKT